jgi:ABC-2 type transport system permease protein
MRVLTIAFKDFYQFIKKWQTFVFMLVMPPIFILMFGGMFSGNNVQAPLILVSNQDRGVIGSALIQTLSQEQGLQVRVVDADVETLQSSVSNDKAAAGLFIENGLDEQVLLENDWSGVQWISGEDILQELNAKMIFDRNIKKVNAAAQFALGNKADTTGLSLRAFQESFTDQYQQLTAKKIGVSILQTEKETNPYAHPAPGMMLQFAIAGLTGVAAILVMEKSGFTEARLRMSAVPAWQVMLGHYLAICLLLGTQFFLLLAFGQIALGLDYLASWLSTLLLSVGTILCVAAMGLLIGVVSKSEDETVVYAMIAMFVLSGLGGLWMPLETTGKAFQTVGHLTPLAWAMDGYQNILAGHYSFTHISGSLAVLAAYTVGLVGITIGIYQRQKSRLR